VNRQAIVLLLAAAAMPAAWAAKTPEQIFQQASQSVVVIHAYDGDGNPVNQGGGVVTARELVTTNCHVIVGAVTLEVHIRQQTYAATPATEVVGGNLPIPRIPGIVRPAVVSSGVLLTRSPPPVRAGLSSQPLDLIRLQGAGASSR